MAEDIDTTDYEPIGVVEQRVEPVERDYKLSTGALIVSGIVAIIWELS